ncbi:MAG: PP0621 family protein [Gammaproteobacteria bacterium]
MRFLLISLFIWLIIVVARRYFQRVSRERQQPTRISTMVRCEWCGLHVPETEAFKKLDKYYCSVQHRDGIENRAP